MIAALADGPAALRQGHAIFGSEPGRRTGADQTTHTTNVEEWYDDRAVSQPGI